MGSGVWFVPCTGDVVSFTGMDSAVRRDGRLMDIVDKEWRNDKLPHEDIAVPQIELPELEPGKVVRFALYV